MIEARTRDTLGFTRNLRIESVHHFCFAGYHATGREGWGALCVLNHTILAPRAGLGPQPLDGVELVTIVRKGVIAHAGSLGGNCRTVAGEVQLISPGQGITHADVNPGSRPAEYVEIRLRSDLAAERAQRRIVTFPNCNHTGHLMLLASGYAEDRPRMSLSAPARVFGARLPAKGALDYAPTSGRHVYVMPLKGRIHVNGVSLETLEGAAIMDEPSITIESGRFAEMVLIDAR